MKRTLSFLLAVIISIGIFSSVPIAVSAANYDSISKARPMYSGTMYYGTISRSDEIDYYKLTINQSSTLNMYAYGVIAGLWVTVYDSNGSVVTENGGRMSSAGITSFTRDIQLITGTYYIRVKYSDHNGDGMRQDVEYGDYQIKVTLTSANESFPEKWGGYTDSISAPNSVSLDRNYNGQIAFNDYDDYYKFTIAESSRVTISVNTTYLKMIYGNIYSADKTPVASFEIRENNLGVISGDVGYELVSGTYYLKLSKGDYRHDGCFSDYECGAYTFKISAVSAKESVKETQTSKNDTFQLASNASINKNYLGQIGVNDGCDFYKFTLRSQTKLVINITMKSSYMWVAVYDKNGREIMDGLIGERYISRELNLPAGEYYLKFEQYEGYYGGYEFELIEFVETPKVRATNTLKGINVTWNAVPGAVKYVVYKRLGTSSTWTIVATTTGTSYSDTNAPSAGSYYIYSVKAYNLANTPSNYEKAKTAVIQRVIAPYTKAANATNGINVTWGKVAGANKYVVLRRIGTESTWRIIGETTGTSFRDTNVKQGIYYIYSIRAVNGTGYSAYDINKRFTIQYITAPSARAYNKSSGVQVSWNSVTGAKKYNVYRRLGGTSTWVYVGTTTGTTLLDRNVVDGKYYAYSVRAINGTGYSAYNASKCVTIKHI